MKKKYYSTLPIICLLVLLSACGNRTENKENESIEQDSIEQDNSRKKGQDKTIDEITIEVEGHQFQTIVYANETTQALMERLPMTMSMEDLHGNEKFHDLAEELPTEPEAVHRIKRGDIMLFGSDCLVLFYKDFDTTYSYTRIGYVKEADTFANVLKNSGAEQVLYFKSN